MDDLVLDECLRIEAVFPSALTLTEKVQKARAGLIELRDGLLEERDFAKAKELALYGLADRLCEFLSIATTLGAESYRHRLSLQEKDVYRAFMKTIDALDRFAAEAEEKHFAMSFGSMLNLSLLYGIEFNDIRRIYAERCIKRYDELKGEIDGVEAR